MEKIVKSGMRDCTVTLDGTECAVKFDSCYRAYSVRNDSSADVYISKTSGIVPDDDGIMCVKAGGSAVFAHMDINADTVYLLGDGKVQIHAQNDTNCRFKLAPAANGGGVIKSMTLTGTTNSAGCINTDFPIATTRIISVSCFNHALCPHVVCNNGFDYWILFFYNQQNGSFVNANVDVSLVIYYVEDSTNI